MNSLEAGAADARLSPWYVTGFVDGDGSFTYGYNRDRTRLAVVFAIRLSRRDRGILSGIRDYFGGIGRLHDAPAPGGPRQSESTAGSTCATCCFKVTRPFELLRVVEHFDRYPLQSEKKTSYAIWREMVFAKAAHHGEPAPDELRRLATALSGCGSRSRLGPHAKPPH
jgi:hypothetical protein